MRRKAAMMLDWFLVKLAGEWLDGLLVGAHSRDYNPTAGSDDATGGRVVGWLYFGGQMPDLQRGEPHCAVIHALSGYRVPEVIAHMAQDRDHPFSEPQQGTGILSLRYGESRRILDYNTWCVKD